MQIIYSPIFLRQYRKLESDIQRQAESKEKVFRRNPFDERLRTHKLHGKLSDLWAFSVNSKVRIVFEFAEETLNASDLMKFAVEE